MAAVLAAGACTGIFQRAMPDRLAEFASSASGGPLRVGAAERDITPDESVWLGGFGLARSSQGIASRLKVRALVLQMDQLRVAVIGVDNLGLMREDVDWIKAGIAGFANGNVFVCASHTHAGPDLIGLWGWYLITSGRDPEYLVRVREATAAAVAEALGNAAPATLVHGRALLPPAGLVKNANRSGVFDRRITVLHARAVDDGRPLGTLLHLACHPEVLSRHSRLLSADFVGELCDAWAARGHGQAVFCNGALGAMISPDVRPRDMDGARAMGLALAELCDQALSGAQPLPVDSIEVRRRDVFLPVRRAGLGFARMAGVVPRELHSGQARSTVGWLRIGAFEVVAVPGEVEPALAQRIRDRAGRPDLVLLGLCDDELGYLMRLQEARHPEYAYERSMSPCLDAGERVEAALLR
jgi:hypothetical protein